MNNIYREGRAGVYGIVLDNLQDAEEQAEYPARTFYKGMDPFELEDVKFVKMFRLTKGLTRRLILLLTPHLKAPARSSDINIQTKVIVSLRFFATGSYQEIIGSNIFSAVSQSSVSRAITEVTDALNEPAIFNTFVHFPGNLQEMENIRTRFYNKYQFPGVVGLIDCTHVAIVMPQGGQEHIYVNRKNYHSINVQLVCDDKLKILNVNSRFPGSCHDVHIYKQSSIAPVMEELYRRDPHNIYYLLGDSGYTLRPWLMTPMDRPPNSASEEAFDARLKTVRSDIERCNGVLKNRFRCLLKHRVLHYTPHRASKIINACVILHNMCIDENIPDPEMDNEIEQVDFGMYFEPVEEDDPANADLVEARRLQ